MTNKRIGLYSYGSGATAEFFSAKVCANYKSVLFTKQHLRQIENRAELTQAQYENFYNFKLPTNGQTTILPKHNTGKFRLSGLDNHKRIYATTTADE